MRTALPLIVALACSATSHAADADVSASLSNSSSTAGFGLLMPGYTMAAVGTTAVVASSAFLIWQAADLASCGDPQCGEGGPGLFRAAAFGALAIGAVLDLVAIPFLIRGHRSRASAASEVPLISLAVTPTAASIGLKMAW